MVYLYSNKIIFLYDWMNHPTVATVATEWFRRGPVLGGSRCDIHGLASARLYVLVVLVVFVWGAGPKKKSVQRKWTDGWVCVFIGIKMVTTDANPMPLVHSILYCRCTRRIGLTSIVTILMPITTQITHMFIFLLPYNSYHSLREIGQKKPYDRQTNVTNGSILNHPRLERAFNSCALFCFHV